MRDGAMTSTGIPGAHDAHGALAHAGGTLLAAPSDSGDMTATTVTPGLGAFVVMFLLAAVIVLLALDMTRRVRRIQARARAEEHLAHEADDAHGAGDAHEADAAHDADADADSAPRAAGEGSADDAATPRDGAETAGDAERGSEVPERRPED